MSDFDPCKLPSGTEFTLGERRWRLADHQPHHRDWMTFTDVSDGADTPYRTFDPSEIQHIYNMGVMFHVPTFKTMHVGQPQDEEPDRPQTRKLIKLVREHIRVREEQSLAGDHMRALNGIGNAAGMTYGDVRELLKEWDAEKEAAK